MNLIKNKNNELSYFQNFVEKFFEDFPARLGNIETSFTPKINIEESDQKFKISAELPGLESEDVDISLVDNVLTIKGEKKNEIETKKENFHQVERSYGSFHRNIPLSVEIVSDKVEAYFKNGVLNILLPKSEKEVKKVKKIEVKAG